MIYIDGLGEKNFNSDVYFDSYGIYRGENVPFKLWTKENGWILDVDITKFSLEKVVEEIALFRRKQTNRIGYSYFDENFKKELLINVSYSNDYVLNIGVSEIKQQSTKKERLQVVIQVLEKMIDSFLKENA